MHYGNERKKGGHSLFQNCKVLLVDDEEAILKLVRTVMQKEGFTHIDECLSGAAALQAVETKEYDLIVLDIMLPDISGFDLCPLIKQKTNTPIVFLSAKSSDLDKLSGFAYGADDYITKPFNPLEVAARAKALLKRTMPQTAKKTAIEEIYEYERFTVNVSSAELFVDQKPVDCSAQLFQLLIFFCKHPNRVFTKHQLYENVWNEHYMVDDNTVMVHIRKLREKIEKNPSQPSYIKTIRGLGYKFVDDGRRQ
ncbi:response regulator transcription factor [Metabacillus indicus]|uniref:response regulator transcription factor n=1 Tax=Metabacillus indicus TaxID=246786 RepID=UPI003CD0CBAC